MESQNKLTQNEQKEAPGQMKKELLRMLMLLEKKDRDELLGPYFKKGT